MLDRPDVNDLIFGGTGRDASRSNDSRRPRRRLRYDRRRQRPDLPPGRHQRGRDPSYLTFNYDTYSEALRLLPRAVTLLDYTPGGPDRQPGQFALMTRTVGDPGAARSTSGAPTRSTARAATTPSTSAAATTSSSVTPATTTSSAAGATTGSPAAPARTASSATTAGSSPSATAARALNGVTPGDRLHPPVSPQRHHHAGKHPGGGRSTSRPAEQVRRPDSIRREPGRRPTLATTRCTPSRSTPTTSSSAAWAATSCTVGLGEDAISGAEALVSPTRRHTEPPARSRRVATDWTLPLNNGNLLGFDARRRVLALRRVRPARRITLDDDGSREQGQRWPVEWFLNNDAHRGRLHERHRRAVHGLAATVTTSSSATTATTGSSAAPARTPCGAAGATTSSTPTTASTPRAT